MRRSSIAALGVLVAGSAADVAYTVTEGSPGSEVNELAVGLWTTYGWWSLAVMKLAIVVYVLGYYHYFGDTRWARRVCHGVCVLAALPAPVMYLAHFHDVAAAEAAIRAYADLWAVL